MLRINLISSPRNISTAFMYSFAQRPDTTVVDEPYYANYLWRSGADHPGKNEVMRHQPVDEATVTNNLFGLWPTPVLFIKNMAHHIALLERPRLTELTNIIFIRDPRQIIASYAEVITAPTLHDIGLEYIYNLYESLQQQGHPPIVLDSGELLKAPETVLRTLCQQLGIDFYPSMLHWQAGPKSYDGCWAPYWYNNVHQSTGFVLQSTSQRELPQHLSALYKQARLYYEKLAPFTVKA